MRCRRHPSILIVATAVIALVVAACGGSSSPSSPRASNSTGHPSQAQIQRRQQDAVRFAACMRAHGVSNFPDPTTSPHAYKDAFNTNSPAFVSAETNCRHLLPTVGRSNHPDVHSHAQVAAMLAFARCIRSHGFRSFPDPTTTGDVTHQMIASAGIDLHQPAVLQAADRCVTVTHGLLTRAAVARFIAGH